MWLFFSFAVGRRLPKGLLFGVPGPLGCRASRSARGMGAGGMSGGGSGMSLQRAALYQIPVGSRPWGLASSREGSKSPPPSIFWGGRPGPACCFFPLPTGGWKKCIRCYLYVALTVLV